MTIYTGDSLRYGRKKLYCALVEMLHDEGIAGATVLHGIEGYGADKQIHTARILDLSADLPVVVVAIDRTEKIEAVLPKLDDGREGPRHDRERAGHPLPSFPLILARRVNESNQDSLGTAR